MTSEGVEVREQLIDLVLEVGDMRRHFFELVGIFEIVAAVWCIQTFQRQIAASLARRLAVALDLSPFTFITGNRDVTVALCSWLRTTLIVLALLGAGFVRRTRSIATITIQD